MGITDRRLFDVVKNLNESARSGFSVGTRRRSDPRAGHKPRASARRLFDEAVERCERTIDARREKIVHERSPAP